MSTLTDEEKAAKFAEGVENPDEGKDETTQDDEAEAKDGNEQSSDDKSDNTSDTEESEDDQISDDDTKDEDAQTFTKKYQNIKGDTPEEYYKNLEVALDNSTGEFHKLREREKENAKIVEQAKRIIAEGKSDDKDAKAEFDLDAHPTIQRLKAREQTEINEAFAKFKEDYPQVADVEDFKRFEIAVAHSGNLIRDLEGREPSLDEMFDKAAENLGWKEVDKVALATKNAGSSSKTNSATKSTSSQSKVSDAQVKVARGLFPGKSDTEIRKELEEYA